MANKYQRALHELKDGKTWQQVADILSDGLGETVHRSDCWNVAKGKSNSSKVETALESVGLIPGPKPRFRLAVEFESEEERQEFKDFYVIDEECSFTEWIHLVWFLDKYYRNFVNEIADDELKKIMEDFGKEGKHNGKQRGFIGDQGD